MITLAAMAVAALLGAIGLLTLADAFSDHPKVTEYVRMEIIVGGGFLTAAIVILIVLLLTRDD